jgi:hypothetical protein
MAPKYSSKLLKPTAGGQKPRTSSTQAQTPGVSTTQLQTQRMTSTTTTTSVAQQITVPSSTTVVQILTQACANSLAKLRHLFNNDNFEPTYVEVPKIIQDMEGVPVIHTKKMGYDTLKRGITERIHRTLDLLVIWVATSSNDTR